MNILVGMAWGRIITYVASSLVWEYGSYSERISLKGESMVGKTGKSSNRQWTMQLKVGWEEELREHDEEQDQISVEREGYGSSREGFRQEEDNGELKGMVVRGSRERNL